MGKNVTEQQRIAAALESMVDTSGEESTKRNVTEQQRIASALETMAEGGGGASALADLTDVDVSSPTDGDTLTYDGTNEKWVAQAGGGGGSDVSIMFVNLDNSSGEQTTYEGEPATSYLCDKTPSQILNHLQNGGVAYFRMHIINDSINLFFINYAEYSIEDNANYCFRSTNTEISNSPSATVTQTIVVFDSEFSEERVVLQTIFK